MEKSESDGTLNQDMCVKDISQQGYEFRAGKVPQILHFA